MMFHKPIVWFLMETDFDSLSRIEGSWLIEMTNFLVKSSALYKLSGSYHVMSNKFKVTD